MTTRRKRRPPPRRTEHRGGTVGPDGPGSWELRNSPYTVEGEIEGFGRLAGGARGGGGSSSRAAIVVVIVAIVVSLGLGVVQLLVDVLRG